jgi:hypothetical protein
MKVAALLRANASEPGLGPDPIRAPLKSYATKVLRPTILSLPATHDVARAPG